MKKVKFINDIPADNLPECGDLYVWRNWDCEGALFCEGATTLDLYSQLRHESSERKADGIFFAFSDKQFYEGLDKLSIAHDDYKGKVFSFGYGGYGTKAGIDNFFAQAESLNNRIKNECDPQEVYIEEYNNHECMIGFDGDEPAIKLIIDIWGVDVARQIRRFDGFKAISEIVA